MRRIRTLCLSVVVTFLLTGVVAAQSGTATKAKLGARSFFPPEYTQEYFLDADALQDTAIWDEFERSYLAGFLRTSFRKKFGFRLDGIEKVRFTKVTARETVHAMAQDLSVTVIEGRKLGLPKKSGQESPKDAARWCVVSGRQAYEDFGYRPRPPWETPLHVLLSPNLLAIGSSNWMRSVLSGAKRGGVIHPRLTSLTALRNPLGYVAVQFQDPDAAGYLKDFPFEDAWLSESDPLRQGLFELRYDEDKEQTTLHLTLRFKTGKAGPKVMREGMEASLKQFAKLPEVKGISGLLQSVQFRRDGTDLYLALELKKQDMRTLGGPGGFVPMFFANVTPRPAQVQLVQAQPEAAAPKVVREAAKPGAKPAAKSGARTGGPTSKPSPKKPLKKLKQKK